MTTQRQPVIWLRPVRAATGRPAERSRADITAAAVALADAEGLAAVSMRRVAAALGTGAASLYRYVATRDDLLELMTDSTAAEYELPPPSGDWQADLLVVARQAREIMRRHPWLPDLVITRPALGPCGVDLLEHVLAVLAGHPAGGAAKLEAFALLMAVTALLSRDGGPPAPPGDPDGTQYLRHVAAAGTHPRLAALFTAAPAAPPGPGDPLERVLPRLLAGLLG